MEQASRSLHLRFIDTKFGLNTRERAFLQMLADGHRTIEISNALGCVKSTYSMRLFRIRDKLDADTSIHAVAIALRRGLIK